LQELLTVTLGRNIFKSLTEILFSNGLIQDFKTLIRLQQPPTDFSDTLKAAFLELDTMLTKRIPSSIVKTLRMEYIKPYTEGVAGITAEEDGRLKDNLLTSFPKLCGQKGFEFHMDITTRVGMIGGMADI